MDREPRPFDGSYAVPWGTFVSGGWGNNLIAGRHCERATGNRTGRWRPIDAHPAIRQDALCSQLEQS